SLKEGVVLFDRQAISLLATNTGGDSFINDRTDIRAIMRLDVKKFDANAVVYGEIDLSSVGA
ncbi:MAG: phage major capsid protein, partial [Cetobacterium sp.]